MDISEEKKTHRKPRAGRKVKKKGNTPNIEGLTAKQRNPKAFTFNSVARAEKRFRRHQDLDTKKQHIPVVDRTPVEPPPIVVVVIGPPKVGKTTLIKCLIKNFTKQPLSNVTGPVTLVSGKKRRITLIECNNDINCMIDLAKVADLVFLVIDGSFGFEMEIFEFLNICQVHGMPQVMGILTHLDMLQNAKTLKHTKKTLKHRFWTEVYPGAKLFYLSGIIHGEYLHNEIRRLSRFISVMKFRPLVWRTSHSYMLVDRMEDLTSPEDIRKNPNCDRTVSLYGYVRGIPLNAQSSVHIPGCGDTKISEVCRLPDPCPLPQKLKKRTLIEKEKLIYAPFSGVGGIVYDKDAVYVEVPGNQSRKNESNERADEDLFSSLVESKETLEDKISRSQLQLFSNAEPITAEDFSGTNSSFESREYEVIEGLDGRKRRKVIFDSGDEADVSRSIQDDSDNADSDESSDEEDYVSGSDGDIETEDDDYRINDNTRAIERIDKESVAFSNSKHEVSSSTQSDSAFSDWTIHGAEDTEDSVVDRREASDNSDDDNDDDSEDSDEYNEPNSKSSQKVMPNNDEEDTGALNWKTNLAQKAADAFVARQNTTANLWKLVYGEEEKSIDDEDAEELVDGLFKVVSSKQQRQLQEKDRMNAEDSSKFSVSHIRDWSSDKVCDSVRDYFVTGKWKESEDASELLKLDSLDNDDEIYGDFEDLETGEKHEAQNKVGDEEKSKKLDVSELLEKKKKLKEKFDAEYDDKDGEGGTYYDSLKQEVSRQAELNRQQFEGLDDEIRVQLEGYRAGMYIRLEIKDAPCELVANLDPTYPLIVGSLQPGEENVGYVSVRIKKHRWYERILKTKNPLIMSIGWRRFQTLPVYSKLEDNFRNRMLKYTPEHVTCMAHFWGPLTCIGTGVFAVQANPFATSTKEIGFRIAATGTVVDCNQTTEITKKLKLIGEPYKIYRKTAFIKNMFNSALEVAKFEGARIKTVSGIRGQIKRAINKPEGAFRATFEDTIKLSDIVFCRTWYTVEVPKLYNPVTNLLLPLGEKCSWKGMKTAGQLKRERGITSEPKLDSLYTPVVRKPKFFKPLKIPARLQRELPYADRPKIEKIGPKDNLKKGERVAVIRDNHEHKVANLMRMVRVNYKQKEKKERRAMKERVIQHKKKVRMEELQKERNIKKRRKGLFIKQTKQNAKEKKVH